MSRTVLQLRQLAARRVRDHWSGTLTSTSSALATALHDTRRIEADGFFRNGFLHVGADATAEDVRVSESDNNGTLTITPALVLEKLSGVVYELHKLLPVEDYNAFIIDALLSAGGEMVLASMDDTSIVLTANTVKPAGMEDEYAIPTGFRYISEISVDDGSGYRRPIPNDQFQVLPGVTTKKLRFSMWAISQFAVGASVRILGQGVATVPTLSDSTAVYIDPDYVVSYVEQQVLTPIAGNVGQRQIAAANRLRILVPLVEQKRIDAAGQFRPLPNVIVVPD